METATPDEALRRCGADKDAISTATWWELRSRAEFEEVDQHETHVVAAFALGPHALLVEDLGDEGVYRSDLSAGTLAVSSFRSGNSEDFSVSRDGMALAWMYLSCLSAIEGDHPDEITNAFAAMSIDEVRAFEDDPEKHPNDLELFRRIGGVSPAVADVARPARMAIMAS
ncbi:DUF6461 domain-containing protein [Umezawaea sp. Da 62-37]|uniref:DUF6461 domain-containing protein n=1 Tax=Umezawaea sp. Da 62-37 TaxID=3075927 RepID=UPI0028F6FE94|nr:DUF6461 domain-containing protein [Umezawaea sp. Da 62-37]WNV87470.1 DUF6461 domain-containing protein [Umezawaea sp. Da 62-37]